MNFTEHSIKILDMLHYLIIDNDIKRSTIKRNRVLFPLHSLNGAPEKSRINVFRMIPAFEEGITPKGANAALPQLSDNFPSTTTIV